MRRNRNMTPATLCLEALYYLQWPCQDGYTDAGMALALALFNPNAFRRADLEVRRARREGWVTGALP